MSSFGIFPLGNLPQSPQGVGSLFENGVSVGQQFTTSIDPATGQTITGNPTMTRWGGGVLLSSNYTHNISVAPITPGDICIATTGATSGNQPLTTGAIPNESSAWNAICANGLPGLQLDWPKSIQIEVHGSQSTPLGVKVFGFDWYGQPMQMKVDNIVSVTPIPGPPNQNITFYTPILRNIPVINAVSYGAITSNKAFYQITRAYLYGTVQPSVTIKIQTCASFGLPYALYHNEGMLIQAFWNGTYDLQATGSQYYTADKVPGDSSNDVRGTYIPASNPTVQDDNRLVLLYYVYGADAKINQWSEIGLPDWSDDANNGIVAPLQEKDLYGLNQYYTGNPA